MISLNRQFLGETGDFFYLGALNSLFLFKFTVFKVVVFHIFDQITDSYAVQILGALAYLGVQKQMIVYRYEPTATSIKDKIKNVS